MRQVGVACGCYGKGVDNLGIPNYSATTDYHVGDMHTLGGDAQILLRNNYVS